MDRPRLARKEGGSLRRNRRSVVSVGTFVSVGERETVSPGDLFVDGDGHLREVAEILCLRARQWEIELLAAVVEGRSTRELAAV